MTNVYLKVNRNFLFYINTAIQKRLGGAGKYKLCYRRRHQIYLERRLMFQSCCTNRQNNIKLREILCDMPMIAKRETRRKSKPSSPVLAN